MLHSYSQIYNLGHAAISELLKHPVLVEEKIDGSQLSFGLTADGELEMRSKGAAINTADPESMFKRGVESITALKDKLTPGWVYRGEYLNSPHHNVITYSRIPNNHVILFEVETADQQFLSPAEKFTEASRIGLECVPMIAMGTITTMEQFRGYLETESILGGSKVEGVVIKPLDYALFGKDKKVLMGKYVSEAFKEVHSKTWNAEHKPPGNQEVIALLAASLATEARWSKAVIHLKERGELTGELKDIGLLMKEVPNDVKKECEAEIKEELFRWAWPQLKRGLIRGFPEWYKERLAKTQFDT